MTEFHTLTVVAVVAAALAFGFALRSIAAGTRMMPKEGEMAPHFTLPNERATPVSLSSLRGKWVVLYFYPKDMTSGCTIEGRRSGNYMVEEKLGRQVGYRACFAA